MSEEAFVPTDHPTKMAEDGVREYDHTPEWQGQPTIRFFPDHFISEVTSMILLLCLFSLLAIFLPSGLDIKANPAVTPEGSKPEWYFLFLYAFLHFVAPIVGTVVPVLGLVVLALVPWIDRNKERNLRRRPIAMIVFVVTVGTIIGLTVLGAME